MPINESAKKLTFLNGETRDISSVKNTISKANGEVGVTTYNPFLSKDGTLFNKYLDYQGILDNPKISGRAKQYIMDATGLTPSAVKISQTATGAELSGANKTYGSTGNSIADTAQKYIGTPYVWGGESMDEGGMDCSGFVYAALRDAGYNIGRTTAQGYRNYGTKVSKDEMQAGDLVFYGKGEASHIGIYLGNGQVIHSSGGSKNTRNNPGKGVIVSDVNHRSDFIEARRY